VIGREQNPRWRRKMASQDGMGVKGRLGGLAGAAAVSAGGGERGRRRAAGRARG